MTAESLPAARDLSRATPDDAELARVLDAYLAAAEAGQPLDAEALIAAHPAIAERLRACLASLQLVERTAMRLSSPGAPQETTGDETGQLGDFRILREVGRDGMGIVYEAEQVSLGRRVALKVLPFAGALDAKQLQRFKNEAHAAAQLHHTNIVPVYSVGCERGVHFYAMQYIEGHSLAEVIAELRGQTGEATTKPQPSPSPRVEATVDAPAGQVIAADSATSTVRQTKPIAALSTVRSTRDAAYFRTVAQLGIQAAEALDYAHEHGIVHRDIKPANLLVDAESRLWITDFGLAQVQSDARLTMTGDLVGTLRYMSPEQALAKRVVVDHRTDVYSLGATLYELLTLEPAFGGTDRQELLRQIAFEEPRPPRRINKTIAAELETIVLKAIEKNPADRYATAKELADDLRHFLDDKPIRARRPTLPQRLRKWGRRHRAVVTAAAVCLFVIATLGGINSMWWVQRRASAHGEATAAIDEATRLLKQERWIEGLSAARRAQAALAVVWTDPALRQQADELAKDLEMAQKLEDARLEGAAVKGGHFDEDAAQAAYAKAFDWYGLDVDNLEPYEAAERIQERPIRAQLTAALDDWARLRGGSNPSGVDHHRLLTITRTADPAPWRDLLSVSLERRDPKLLEKLLASSRVDEMTPAAAVFLANLARRTPAAAERAAVLLRQLQQRHPADFWVNHELALLYHRYLRPPRLEEAFCFYSVSVALRPKSPGVHLNLGTCLADSGKLDDAIIQYREAIDLHPDYAEAHDSLGRTLLAKGRLDEAVSEFREAIQLKKDLPDAHWCLGKALSASKRFDEAIAEFREAIGLKKDHHGAHLDLGIALLENGQRDEALTVWREDIHFNKESPDAHVNLGNAFVLFKQYDEAIAEYRDAILLNKEDAEVHSNLGEALSRKGLLDEAIVEHQEAIRLGKNSKNPAVFFANLGVALARGGKLAEAEIAYRKAIELQPDAAKAYICLGDCLRQLGKLAEAEAACRKAVELKPHDATAHNNLGAALGVQGKLAEAVAAYRKAIELKPDYAIAQKNLRGNERLLELDAKLPKFLQHDAQPADLAERVMLAQLCQQFKKLNVAAFRFYADAFVVEPKLQQDLNNQHRYNAACAAALAGCGQGKDADQSDDKERVRLRRRALDWLHADLAAYQQLLDKEPDKVRPVVLQRMQHWQQDKDFAGVRGSEALAKLPEAERQEWQKLWAEVDELRQKAAKPAK
jgi:serine/threonine protein kinase/Flp pilus assembly protein TadD